ncbi:uncharacterized protein LOC125770136 [Anopheles funestus]|uniref:uncharacterized protein LOC125770136 n=1 Tax=Anopheles funestus TaxID=62324 RepID=UPI0020C651F7|nr:uncharacterized protein LOC125770136 [Anopheles funestus]XP_049295422.1 uncharacterized protein LOC125770136 [Anopheles funestus]
MGDLLALLNDIKNNENKMEFCEDFHQLQIILNAVNQYIHPFDKIVFDSGNGPYIIEVVARLLKYLRVHNYLNANNKVNIQYEPELRRITMYLLLNTDVSFRYDLIQEPRVNHLLNSLPQLTKCLLMNCIWGLDLDRFFYEMLRYAPLWFSMQFIDQAIVSLKYGKPHEVLIRIESMVCAIYFAMCRTDVDWQNVNRGEYVNHQRTLARMSDYVGDMLRFVNTPEASKFEGWSKLRKHRYFGFVLKHMFSMTMACLDLYFRKPAIPVDPAMSVYQLMDDLHVDKPAPIEYSQATVGTLLKINHFLLNTLEICIMHVSLECFCYWAEINLFKDGQESVTLQQIIGESAYRLCEELNSHKHFRHSIVRHLTQFALRPKTLTEKAATLTLGTLMNRFESADSVEERMVYLHEFINRGEQVFDNAECLEVIEQHCDLLTAAHLRPMIEFDKGTPVDESELSDERVKLREIILRTVGELLPSEFHLVLTYIANTFGKQFCWYDISDLVPATIQLVNRLQKPSDGNASEVPHVQKLLFQSPEIFFNTMVKSLFAMAPNGNQDQLVDAIVDIIMRYKTVAKVHLREHLKLLLVTDFSVCHSTALQRFAQQLYEMNLFPTHEFMEQFMLKGLQEAYERKHESALYALLALMANVWPSYCAKKLKDSETIVRKQTLLKEGANQLALLSDRMRYDFPPPSQMDANGPNLCNYPLHIMSLVSMATKQLVLTLDQLAVELPDEDLKKFLQELKEMVHNFTKHYVQDRLSTLPTVPTLSTNTAKDKAVTTQSDNAAGQKKRLHTSLFTPDYFSDKLPAKDATEDSIINYVVQILTQCTQEEILELARYELIGAHMLALSGSKLKDCFKNHPVKDWVPHCMGNYVACLWNVLLPVENERGNGVEACKDAVCTIVELISELKDITEPPECSTLQTQLTLLYDYVRRVAPTVELAELMSFLQLEQRPKSVIMDVSVE